MEANELRIGNLVEYKITDKFDERKEWWEVSKIDADDIHWLSKDDPKDEDFRPIPLTEEWLLKLGFECISDGGDQKRFALKNRNSNYFYAISLDHEEICLERKDIMGYYTLIWNESYLQYVHQLQNLFFSLCGIELVSF